MPLNKLHARQLAKLPPGKHSDGGGLWLFKRDDGGASWVLRLTIHGRRREMGLGRAKLSEHDREGTSLSAARDSAATYRAMAKGGIDPIR